MSQGHDQAERLQETSPRIVVGVDGSRPAAAALRWAVRQAQLTGATLDAVIAWQYPLAVSGMGWAPTTVGADDVDYSAVAAKTLSDAVGDVAPQAGGVTVREIVIAGNPAQALLDTAQDADLLVVGNRGHGGFSSALLGSVSQNCVHHAACPVVIVRAPHGSHE